MKKRFISIVMALLLVAGVPVSAFADTFYLDDGSLQINATAADNGTDTNYAVSQYNGTSSSWDDKGSSTSAPVVQQNANNDITTATQNTVTINVGENATADVTIKDVNIFADGDTPLSNDATAAVTVNADGGATANVTLNNVNINVKETSTHKIENEDGTASGYVSAAAVSTEGAGDVVIELDNTNTLKSGKSRAGLEKSGVNGSTLTIKDDNNVAGSLDATGGGASGGAGIGGSMFKAGSDITITGGTIKAIGGTFSAGIGGYQSEKVSNITISGGNVTAIGTNGGAGIGGGAAGTASKITISGTAKVKVQGSKDVFSDCVGAGIGNGIRGNSTKTNDEEVTPITCELYEGGYVKYWDADKDINDETQENTGKRITGAAGGVHNFEVVERNATCTTDGGKYNSCIFCDKEVLLTTIPAKGHHTWDSGKVTTPATTEATGVKTYTCTACNATKTEVIPKLTPAASNTVAYVGQYSSAPLYRVTNEGNYDTEHTAVLKDGVLTITAEKDFASLKGRLWGIKVLMSQGVEKIVFVTNGATSAFVLADLLAEGGAADSYVLTHDGANVTFTLGSGNADISSILQS